LQKKTALIYRTVGAKQNDSDYIMQQGAKKNDSDYIMQQGMKHNKHYNNAAGDIILRFGRKNYGK